MTDRAVCAPLEPRLLLDGAASLVADAPVVRVGDPITLIAGYAADIDN